MTTGAVIFLTVAYDGAPFAGFQRQAGVVTVQSRLEEALATVYRREVLTSCAGRTDAGVHALGQVVSYPEPDSGPDDVALLRSLVALAGPHIVVKAVRRAVAGSDARFSALSREYRYRLVDGRVPPLFLAPVSWWVKHPLDLPAMQRAGHALVGNHDFGSFCVAATAREKATVRTVMQVDIRREVEFGETCVLIRIVGNAFVHSMVRIVVGTLAEIGTGRRDEATIPVALAARDRTLTGQTAPPQGLTLWRVVYPDGLWLP